ncbi:beta strand repeat-containing protein [Emticicia aquatica]|nr:hypothetical protein [Emticicia aquatica]
MAQAQQKIGTSPGTLEQSAVLELGSSDVAGAKKGFLGPRVNLPSATTYSLGPVGTAAVDGMIVYAIGASGLPAGYYVWQNAKWNLIQAGAAATTNSLGFSGSTLTSTVNGVDGTVTLPTASGTVTGLLSSANFNTFNGKENVLGFSNGLTRNTNAIKLGGALTENTFIATTAAFNMNYTGAGKLNAPLGGFGMPQDSRRGIFSSFGVSTGAVYGMEQVSFGQSGNQTALRLFSGTGVIAFGNYTDSTNYNEAGRFMSGRFGLGTINPSNKLHVVGTNPLKLEGLQTITPLTTDSVLVFSGAGGVIKKALVSSLVGAGVTASNGLNESGGVVQLGGTLSKATTVAQSTFNLSFTGTGNVGIGTTNPTSKLSVVETNPLKLVGLQAITPTVNDSVLVYLSAGGGVIKRASITSLVGAGVTAENGVSELGGKVTLGGNLLIPTTIGTTATNTLSLTGIQAKTAESATLALNDSILVISNTGRLVYRAASSVSPVSSVTAGNGLAVSASGALSMTAPTASSITGGADVTAGSPKVALGGTPLGAALKAFTVDVNEGNLSLANIGGTLPVTKLVTGTDKQVLQVVGTTPTWVTPSAANSQNIYTTDGTLTGSRTVSQATNNLIFSGTGKTIVGTIAAPSLTHAGRLAAVTGSNAIPSLTIMNDSTTKVGNEASIGFRTQGSLGGYGYTARISAVQTDAVSVKTALSFGTYDGSGGAAERMRIASNGLITVNNLAGTGSRMVVANASGDLSTQAIPTGTVASVGLSVPNIFTTGAAITSSGNLTLGLATQSPNLVWAGPSSGTAAAMPTFRALALADLPAIPASALIGTGSTSGQALISTGPTTAPTWQPLPASTNIYNADGALTGSRTVAMGANNLTFTGTTGLTAIQSKTVVGATTTTSGAKLSVTSSGPDFSFEVDHIGAGPANSGGNIRIRSARAAGTASLLGEVIGSYRVAGSTTAGFSTSVMSMSAVAEENFTSTNQGTGIAFNTVPLGSTSTVNFPERMRISANGDVGIGTSAPRAKLHIQGSGLANDTLIHFGTDRPFAFLQRGTTLTSALDLYSLHDKPFGITGSTGRVFQANLNPGSESVNILSSFSSLNIDRGYSNSNVRLNSLDTLELQSGSGTTNANQIALLPNGFVSIGSYGTSTKPAPKSTLDVNGSLSLSTNYFATATTNTAEVVTPSTPNGSIFELTAEHHTLFVNAANQSSTFGTVVRIPYPASCAGRVYVIRKVDETSNAVSFVTNSAAALTTWTPSFLKVTQTAIINSLNYVKTIRIQSDGNNWWVID